MRTLLPIGLLFALAAAACGGVVEGTESADGDVLDGPPKAGSNGPVAPVPSDDSPAPPTDSIGAPSVPISPAPTPTLPGVSPGGPPVDFVAPIAPDLTSSVWFKGQCVPYSLATSEPFDEQPASPSADDGPVLARTAASLVGSWVGVATSPWTPPWTVGITFTSNTAYEGQYAAQSLITDSEQRPFYYGPDATCELTRWRLLDVDTNGVGGELDVTFGSPCYLPGWQGELDKLVLDQAANRLRFSFSRSDGYGPLTYDLFRTCDSPAGMR